MKKKKLTYHDREVKVSVESYQNNGTLALMLVYDNDDSDVITVNLNSRFQSDSMAFLDTNNYPDIEKWIQKNNLGLPMGVKNDPASVNIPFIHYLQRGYDNR